MAERSYELERILNDAYNRRRTPVNDYFNPPKSIIKFGRKVLTIMENRGIFPTIDRFRHEFISVGVGKLGLSRYVEKVVPHIHIRQEFGGLLRKLGVDVQEDEWSEIRVLVCGDEEWVDGGFIRYHLNQLPRDTTIIEGARDGADELAGKLALEMGMEIDEYSGAGKALNMTLLKRGKPDFALVFHEDPLDDRRIMHLVKLARKHEVSVKILTGSKRIRLNLDELIGETDE